MRMSQLFVQTLREAPADARTAGYRYLLRGGFIVAQEMGTGAGRSFLFLPLGVRVRERVEAAVKRVLASLDGQPVAAPAVRSPASHEVAVLRMASNVVRSYRQLPVLLYEGWQVYSDDERIADGLLGAAEGRVIDACGLYRDSLSAESGYQRMRTALSGLLAGWGLDAVEVILSAESASRPTGHATLLRTAEGEVNFASCAACGHAAEISAARLAPPPRDPEAALPAEDVATPHCKTIAELAAYLGIPAARTAKALFLSTYSPAQGDQFVLAVVRGDTALDEHKLRAALKVDTLGPATEAEIRAAGAEPGYGSPVGLAGVTVVIDELVARTPNLVAGANRPGYHTLNVNAGRDYQPSLVADIAGVQDGSPCPQCGSPLILEQGVALTELRQCGGEPGRRAGAMYLDEAGQSLPVASGSYRIFVDRLLAACAERFHDKSGFTWPAAIAPFDVHLITLGKANEAVSAAATRLYAELSAAGLAVLFDDRDERAGVKFNDADLIGAPLRVVIGDRGLQSGTAEVKQRSQAEAQQIKLGELVDYAQRS